MKRLHKSIVFPAMTAVIAIGLAGQASAGASTLFCGYQAEDGSTWQTSHVYPATRQCAPTNVRNGVEGTLVYREVIH